MGIFSPWEQVLIFGLGRGLMRLLLLGVEIEEELEDPEVVA
jgi:hypothetical protein